MKSLDSSATTQLTQAPQITAGERARPTSLTVLSYADGFTSWHYRGSSSAVLDAGYFEPIHGVLREGDEIIVTVPHVTGARRARGFVQSFASDLAPIIEWEYVSPSLRGA